MTDAEVKAVELLTHYFHQAGVVVNNDSGREIARCVHKIIQAAVEETLNSAPIRQLFDQHTGPNAERNDMTTEKRKMLLLHHYKTGAEIWCDPNLIGVLEQLQAEPKSGFSPEGIPPRTRVWCNCGESAPNLMVSELPGEIAAHARWAIQLADEKPKPGAGG